MDRGELPRGIRRYFTKAVILLEMIQFKLTVFALPFALMGAFIAAGGVPELTVLGLVLAAMVCARTCAMTFNRIVDRDFDGANPRTSSRAIPAGSVRTGEAWCMLIVSGLLFMVVCALLNPLVLQLSPFALGLTLVYSYTKRFTALCHLVLGVALALAPLGGWLAVSGQGQGYPYLLSVGVMLWVAGFDIIYGCLDREFDAAAGLHSIAVSLGKRGAFRLAAVFHLLAFVCFVVVGFQASLGTVYLCGVAIAAVALVYQHLVVRPDDLRRMRVSFFQMNGIISLAIFGSTWLSLTLQ